MKSALIGSALGVLAGMSIGFAVGVWLMADVATAGAPKYRLQDFPKVPPVIRQNGYGHEPRINAFRCIGGEKDCGLAQPIPEPGTALLVGSGLLVLLGRRP